MVAWHGTNLPLSVTDLWLDPCPKYTDERKVSLGVYFTTNRHLAECYGNPIKANLSFKNLLDLTALQDFTPVEFFGALPVDVPMRLKAEIVGGYTGQLEAHHILEQLLCRYDLVAKLKLLGFDGIAFREAYSDVYVPFSKAVIN